MTSVGAAERGRISGILQTASDKLAANLPDKVSVRVEADRFLFAAVVWTSAMTREHQNFDWRIDTVFAAADVIAGTMSWEDAAPAIIDELIGRTIRVQEDRWTLAKTLGLVRDGAPTNLPPSEMLIDRTLLAMLEHANVDVRRAATCMMPCRETQVGDELPSITIGASSGKIFARQLGIDLPIASSWVSISQEEYVHYDGTYLALDGPLPDAVLTASAGLRLGDVIGTGLPDLDARIIVGIFDFGQHPHGITIWEEALLLYVQLAPDHVRLGAPATS